MGEPLGRHTGYKATVVRVITQRPCFSFFVTLLIALILGGVGFALGAMQIDTEGWETRGTEIADRAMTIKTWKYGKFTLSEGVPLAFGRDEDSRRRRLLSLDDEDVNNEVSQRLASEVSHEPGHRGRALLDSHYTPKPCAHPYSPKRCDDDPDCTHEAREDADRYLSDWDGGDLVVIFSDSADLLAVESLKEMCHAEDRVMAMSGYSDVCIMSAVTCTGNPPSDPGLAAVHDGDRRCLPPMSLVRIFMAKYDVRTCDEFTTKPGLDASIEATRTKLATCADAYRAYQNITADCAANGFIPALINAGFGPSPKDRLTATLTEFKLLSGDSIDWMVEKEKGGDIESALSSSAFSAAYNSKDEELKDRIVDEALNSDMLMATGAILIVLVLIWVHTGSALLTLGGMLQVLLAFPSAVFFTTMVLRITFFPFLNFIGLFVLIGVGADDCFVFYDKWTSAKAKLPPGATATEVGANAYWEATWAMFLTSTTTASAFLASTLTPIAPIRVFSVFMATMIIFDYLYNITVFAACVAFQHELMRNGSCSLFCLDFFAWYRSRNAASIDAKYDQEGAAKPESDGGSAPERFCREKLYPPLHTARWVLIVVLLALGGVALHQASKLTTPTDNNVLLLGEDHPMEQYGIIKKKGFMDSKDAVLWVSVNWGLTPYDEPVYNHLNPKKYPNLKLDTSFDASSSEAQEWLVKFCDDTSVLKNEGSGHCPFKVFKSWVTEQSGRYTNRANNVPYDDNGPDLDTYATECDTSGFPVPAANFDRCMAFFARYGVDQGWVTTDKSLLRNLYQPAGTSGDADVKLFFLRVEFASNISWTEPVDVLRADFNAWESYITDALATAPVGLRSGFHSGEAWHWMDTVEQMEAGAYGAAGITVLVSGFIIFLGTGNLAITLYSLIVIACILGSVVACVVGMGWTLGFLEGICFTILIGLSVDFVIHIGVAYHEVAEEFNRVGAEATRTDCTREAVAQLGFPIISAAFTTLISAIILFFAQITFFNKFGLIVMLSMVIAVLTTFLLYVPILDALGPQGHQGDVWHWIAKCRKKA